MIMYICTYFFWHQGESDCEQVSIYVDAHVTKRIKSHCSSKVQIKGTIINTSTRVELKQSNDTAQRGRFEQRKID